MRNFYPAIVVQGQDVIHNHFATSHKDLLDWAGIVDDYLAVTFRPIDDKYRYDDLKHYVLMIEQHHIPEWFTKDVELAVIGQLTAIIKNMIVGGRRKLVLNEGVILNKHSIVGMAKNAKIFAMYDSAKIRMLTDGSEVLIMTDNTLINEMHSNTLIHEMLDKSRINELLGNSRVNKMYGQSKILKMRGNSRVDVVKGHSNIKNMDNEAFAYTENAKTKKL